MIVLIGLGFRVQGICGPVGLLNGRPYAYACHPRVMVPEESEPSRPGALSPKP